MTATLNFDFESNLVRVIERDGEPWFVGKDVCRALDIKNDRDALQKLDDDERDVAIADTLGGPQEMTIVSEPGVYRLVFTSRKPEAEVFKRWIAHKVLPALRKTGEFRVDLDPAPLLPPPAGSADPMALMNWRLSAVKEARLLFGPARAARLWSEMGLPEAPGPAPADVQSRECLEILMESRLFDPDCGDTLRDYLHIVVSLEDEAAAARLAAKGVRPVFEGEQGILVANAGTTLDEAYKATRWRAMRWRYGLRQLPGVRAHDVGVRFGGPTHRATFIPLAVAMAV